MAGNRAQKVGMNMEATKEKKTDSKKIQFFLFNSREWEEKKKRYLNFSMLPFADKQIRFTKAEVHGNCLTGTMAIPNRKKMDGPQHKVRYYLTREQLVVVTDSSFVAMLAKKSILLGEKKGAAAFFYYFINEMMEDDLELLEKYEKNILELEDRAMERDIENFHVVMLHVRKELLTLRFHYEQMIDLCEELEENKNGFFAEETLSYFHLLEGRIERFLGMAGQLVEDCIQARELYQAEVERRRNNTMQILTVFTTIFFPLSLIAGWYGMNFSNMPELQSSWGYPVVIVISLAIVIGSVVYFKKKKIL